MVRIFKNVRNRLVRDRLIAEDSCPSYCVECLIYNAADYCFSGNYQTSYSQVIRYLLTMQIPQFMSQNAIVPLFGGSPVQWNATSAANFLNAARNLANNWR